MQLLGRHPGEYEMTKEVIEVHFDGVAARKLRDLFERGYTVCGVAIQRTTQNSNFDRGAITTGGMVMWWRPEQHKSEQVPAPQNLYQITGNVADVNTVLIERAELHRLQAENDGLRALASGGIDLFERYSTFKAKCEELEAMLDAVGAGGVGQSIRPSVQADTAPQPTRQPLTDEQIKSAVRHLYASNAVAAMASSGDIDTARAIEAAHGITGGQP